MGSNGHKAAIDIHILKSQFKIVLHETRGWRLGKLWVTTEFIFVYICCLANGGHVKANPTKLILWPLEPGLAAGQSIHQRIHGLAWHIHLSCKDGTSSRLD